MTGLSVLLRNAIAIIYSRGVLQPYQASGGLGMEWGSWLHFDLSLEMAIHTSNSFEMPLLLSTFSNVLPQVICGQPIGRVAKKHQQIALSYVLNNSPEQVAGHVARMPMTRAPGQLLTCWVPHSSPDGCPEMTRSRTLKKALRSMDHVAVML
jgi:hypothetical protein